ncbi:MAG TPA: flagellar hook-length control protein FliK [Desulfocapsa sulfexigens]|nr:flagellar hook-length control protein FliK [Desulfocapsa sulfexigens]
MPDTKTENGAIQTKQAGIPFSIIDDSNKSTQKSAKLEGVHQDVSEQFLNAKLGQSKGNTKDNTENTNSGQNGFNQPNKGELQQAATTPGNTVTEVKVVESSFGQQPGQVSGSATQTTSSGVEGKFAPGAQTPVPEKELVANLIHRFSVNPRLQTSRITMQLNPAELGSLKIDILVKDDSIKANVIAQSQQVLETLEKSVPRLRSVLEEQGFRIDSFEISMDGDGGSQKELFQEQFNSKQHGFASRESSTEKTDSFDTLLNTQEETLSRDEEKTGVNLTI